MGKYLYVYVYKISVLFKDECVLVIGCGNFGCDCVVEISWVVKYMGISIWWV